MKLDGYTVGTLQHIMTVKFYLISKIFLILIRIILFNLMPNIQ